MKAFFRMVAACFKTESAATSLAGVVVIVVALFTGYTIPKPDIPGALHWIMYINVRFSIAIVGLRAYFSYAARALWFRGSSDERVPYCEWHLLHAGAFRSWVPKCFVG
jgi:hypothetical protein